MSATSVAEEQQVPKIFSSLESPNIADAIAQGVSILSAQLDAEAGESSSFKTQLIENQALQRLAIFALRADHTEETQLATLSCLCKVAACSNDLNMYCQVEAESLQKLTDIFLRSTTASVTSDVVRVRYLEFLVEYTSLILAHRDSVLAVTGIVPSLVALVEQQQKNDSEILLLISELMAHLSSKKPSPSIEAIQPFIPVAKKLLHHPNVKIVEQACTALSNMTDGPPARINVVMEGEPFLPRMIELLRSGNSCFAFPVLRTFGNFTCTNPEMTQIVIDLGLLNHLNQFLLPNVGRTVRKEVLWLLSNVMAGYDNQVNAVFGTPGLIQLVIQNMTVPEFEVAREAVWAISNCTATAPETRIRYLAEACDVIPPLCHALSRQDSHLAGVALETLEAILICGETAPKLPEHPDLNPYVARVMQVDGVRPVHRWSQEGTGTVFIRAVTILERYFPDFDAEKTHDEKLHQEGEGYDEDNNDFDENTEFNI